MSEENVEKLRQAYEAFSRGDFDEALTFAHPDIEFCPPGKRGPISRHREVPRLDGARRL
jgi:ketosteroid isomerase-like protein